MAISQKLEMRQGQSLVMTPQLQQAIKLLQLSNLELTSFVETELERNPVLERHDDQAPLEAAGPLDGAALDDRVTGGQGADQANTGAAGDDSPAAASDDADHWIKNEQSADDMRSQLDTDYSNIDPDASVADRAGQAGEQQDWAAMRLGGQGGGGFADGEHNLENYVSEQQTLRHHLHHQLAICTCDQVTRAIIDHLIECVDEAGYLRTSCEQVALQMGTDLDRVTAALGVLQSMDPAGVGARSLSECLRLQLSDQGRLTEKLGLVLDNLHLMAKHDLVGLRRISGTDKKQLYSILNTIRTLDPKPGHKFGTTPVQPVSPDVFVRPRNDGSWLVELNTDTLPRVLVNNSYYTTVVAGVRTAEDKTYLSECMQTANWLVKSLDQRAHTILKVAREIVRQQDGFLTKGVEHLRPLNLKTVADAISMHESTVSRVTSNKYIETPRGLFEFKYFFTSAISSAVDGDDHSSEAVRHKIKQLIDAETASTVLSDDKIVILLKDAGIDIARRTVAKYREAMHIPSSVQRRRVKRMQAERQLVG